jgi:uncharacterized protein YqeY
MIKDQITADLKQAMLAGDKLKVEVLRGLKSAILYAEVAAGARSGGGLDDIAVTAVLSKESKKRQESADLYTQGGAGDKAQRELSEKAIIDGYLPASLSEAELQALIDKVVTALGGLNPQTMGQVIGRVKLDAGPAADGAIIARLVKETMGQ